jgi:hypothetical protein
MRLLGTLGDEGPKNPLSGGIESELALKLLQVYFKLGKFLDPLLSCRVYLRRRLDLR